MAIVVKNILLRGLSGSIGKTLVFRQCNGNTIVAQHPAKRKKAPTEGQRRQQERFRDAVAYARWVLEDADRRLVFEQKVGDKRRLFQFVVRERLRRSM